MRAKPLEIFVIAEQFYWAGEMLVRVPYEAAAGNPYYMIGRGLPNMQAAAIACRAFSLELYFKCLIRIGRKPPTWGHNLVDLFNAIGVRPQAAIKRYFRQNIQEVRAYLEREYGARGRPTLKIDFDDTLSGSKDAFQMMRYLYEKGIPPNTGWMADPILDGARQVILDKHPDWKDLRQTPFAESILRSRG